MLTRDHALADRQHDVVGQRFSLKKAADHFACSSEGFFVLVESKATRTDTFPFSRIKEHQWENLSKVADTKYGEAFLALNFRDERGPGSAYLIPWDYWCDFEKRWSKKSIRREEAIDEFHQCKLVRITAGWTKTR